MRKTSKWAAPVQTEAASKINTVQDITTPANCSSNVSGYAPDRRANTERRVEQLRLFALDGVLSEPYVPARARNSAATSAAAVEGMTQ